MFVFPYSIDTFNKLNIYLSLERRIAGGASTGTIYVQFNIIVTRTIINYQNN